MINIFWRTISTRLFSINFSSREIDEWLKDNCIGEYYFSHSSIGFLKQEKNIFYIYVFEKKEDAILFKLTWG